MPVTNCTARVARRSSAPGDTRIHVPSERSNQPPCQLPATKVHATFSSRAKWLASAGSVPSCLVVGRVRYQIHAPARREGKRVLFVPR